MQFENGSVTITLPNIGNFLKGCTNFLFSKESRKKRSFLVGGILGCLALTNAKSHGCSRGEIFFSSIGFSAIGAYLARDHPELSATVIPCAFMLSKG